MGSDGDDQQCVDAARFQDHAPLPEFQAAAVFDLHRPYRITQIEVAQPTKLEDRIGGPTKLELRVARRPEVWEAPRPFEAHFPVTVKNATEPDTQRKAPYDRRHDRAWLSWRVDLPETRARWLRIDLRRVRPNSSISLGEVVIHAIFDGEIEAQVKSGGRILPVGTGRRWRVEPTTQ